MPIYKVLSVGETSSVGIWHCTEPLSELTSLLDPDEPTAKRLSSFSGMQRKIHFLATRLLLKELLGATSVEYLPTGKPFVPLTNTHISISHSHDFVAAMVSSSPFIGIDIQHIDPKIIKIRDRFVNDTEYAQIDKNDLEVLTIIWSIKESIYKIHGDRNVFFKEHITIPNLDERKSNRLQASLNHHLYHATYPISLDVFENYVLVYTCFD